MVAMPILAVQKGKGVLFYSREGTGTLFLDSKIRTDREAIKVIDTAYSLPGAKNKDVLIRSQNSRAGVFVAQAWGFPFIWECLPFRGKKSNQWFLPLAALIKAVLGKVDKLLVPGNQGLPIMGMDVMGVADVQEAAQGALSL